MKRTWNVVGILVVVCFLAISIHVPKAAGQVGAVTGPSAKEWKYYPDWESVLTPFSPEYPQEAILRGIEGQVALEVTIDSNGQLSDSRVLKSDSGLLTSAAVRMIQTPRIPKVCTPPQPAPCTQRAVFDFELNQRDHPKDAILFLAPKVVQAPPDLLITHPEVAMYPVDAHDLGGTRISRSCAAFQLVLATRNIGTLLEFGKMRGGIRRLTDTSTLPLLCQSQFGGEGKFVA